MKQIDTLLRRKIGLDVASVGATAIERTVRLRMKSQGFKDVAAYLAHVNDTPNEWEELLEAVVVTETWFFRDVSPFAAFVQLARQETLQMRPEPLRVLSVPCSTGEEPYSLVMALRDAGLAPERFIIEGVDISPRALERAQRGFYGKNSFRGKVLGFRHRHFTSTKDGFLLKQEVRDGVRFRRGNLLEEKFLADSAPYDFIFCRNLLIYFDRTTQRRALQRLQCLLTDSGVLFVGAAELPLVQENGFSPINLPMAFACRKSDAGFDDVDRRTVAGAAGVLTPKLAEAASLSAAPLAAIESPVVSVSRKSRTRLDEARELADAGRLEAAVGLCEAHVKELGPSAEAYYLLGLVFDATGDATAVDYYRKALYLEPDHYETLLQMALLLERSGDRSGAQIFKRRAERLQHKAGLSE